MSASLPGGFGLTASFSGFHSTNSGNGIPLSFVTETFGPSYVKQVNVGRYRASIFVRSLIGEANGFSGVYPQAGGPSSSSNGFAAKVGGGFDIRLSRRISVRVLEADWLKTGLPNATTNVQNDFRLGAGIVIRINNH
jgi:hypothetical protein